MELLFVFKFYFISSTRFESFESEEFEDTKGVIRIRKSKKDRQYNGQMKQDKRRNNDLQNITHKTKD